MASVTTGNLPWGNAAWSTLEAANNNAQQAGATNTQAAAGALSGPAKSTADNSKYMLWGGDGQEGYLPYLQGTGQQLQQNLGNQFNLGNYVDPNSYMSGLGAMQGIAGGLQQNAGLAGQGFAGGGWTPGYQATGDTLGSWMNGGLPQTGNVNNLSNSLLNNFGQTAGTQNYAARASDAMNIGQNDYNNLMSAISNPLAGVLNNQGSNQYSNALLGTGQNIMGNMGATPTSNALQAFGSKTATQNPLMNPSQAVSLATGNAANQIKQAAESARAKALARGGGAGSTVANGAANEALADFAGQGANVMDNALQGALTQQQQLGLQEQAQGTQQALGGGNLQQGMLGLGTSAANQGGQLANSLYTTGLGLVPSLMGQSTNNAGTMGQLGLGALGAENARMNTGLQGAQQLQTGALGAGGLNNSMMANQNQYALGLGGLQNQMAGTQGTLMNQSLANQLGLGQLGLGYGTAGATAQNNMYNSQLGLGNLYNSNFTAGMNPLTALYQGNQGAYNQTLANLPGFSNSAANLGTYNPYGNLMSLLGQLGGAAIK